MSDQKKSKSQIYSVGIVIPVYRDEGALNQCLANLVHQLQWPIDDIIVVAAGDDFSCLGVSCNYGVSLIQSPEQGRGEQLNYGADYLKRDVIIFLHADTILPESTREEIERAMKSGLVGGAFSRRFSGDSQFLRFTCWLADWRCRFLGWFLGDQAIFISRENWKRLGGFPEWTMFEDLEFSRRMKRIGKTFLIEGKVLTSNRRFEKRGAFKQTLLDLMATVRYFIDNSNKRLKKNNEA